MGSPPPGTIGVYVGRHPNYIHRQGEYEGVKPTKVKGRVFDRDVEWDAWSVAGGLHTMEVIEPMSREHPETLVHLFVTGQDADTAEAMRKMAETLTPRR